jgi:hypothetical protein
MGYHDTLFTPIWNKTDFRNLPSIRRHCGPEVQQYIMKLPCNKYVMPEMLVYNLWFPFEPILLALIDKAWGVTTPWQVYARLCLAQRLRAKQDAIFTGPMEDLRDDFLDFQLYGGKRSLQAKLREQARLATIQCPDLRWVSAMARLIGSTMDETTRMSLLKPFHFLRLAVGLQADHQSVFCMSYYQKEKQAQKEGLFRLMVTDLDQKTIDSLL